MNDGRMAAARPIVDSLPRRRLGPALCVAAIALMLYGAFWPIFGVPAGRAVQLMAVLAAAVLLIGGVLAPQGSQLAFTLLWASFGMTCAIGTLGIFSVGFVFLIAAVLILLAIFATPNNSPIELRYDRRYIAAFFIGNLTFFLSLVLAAISARPTP